MVPECFCAEGYELTQKHHCKALGDNATLVVANENTLRHLDPYGLNYLVDVDEERSEGANKIQVCIIDLLKASDSWHSGKNSDKKRSLIYVGEQ